MKLYLDCSYPNCLQANIISYDRAPRVHVKNIWVHESKIHIAYNVDLKWQILENKVWTN